MEDAFVYTTIEMILKIQKMYMSRVVVELIDRNKLRNREILHLIIGQQELLLGYQGVLGFC